MVLNQQIFLADICNINNLVVDQQLTYLGQLVVEEHGFTACFGTEPCTEKSVFPAKPIK